MHKEALFYVRADDNRINCNLCPHKCSIIEGKRGICGISEVREGKLYSVNYGEITSVSLDPIEKKPLFHFRPGTEILSIGSYGCNFKCGFCQNYSISQYEAQSQFITPEHLVDIAVNTGNNIGLAFTYNEPLIGYEFLYHACQEAKKTNIDTVIVTNGYINPEPFKKILPDISATNIDLKAFTNRFYKDICFGDLDTVLNNINLANNNCHVEITTLLVNEYNDSDDEIRNLSKWLAQIDENIPLHLSRYYPVYKFKAESTPIDRVLRCREIAKEYLNYVYIGNIDNVDNNTYCPKCNEIVIKRNSRKVSILCKNGICPNCGFSLNVIL